MKVIPRCSPPSGSPTPSSCSSESGADAYWYVRFWGPWFLLGGLLFMTAGWAYMRNSSNRRIAVGASVLGGLGGLAAVAAPLVVSALASPA